jgi:diguanylate cyclase (GGDEF)-like protein/PAS domain S-box-containing protein
MVGKVSTATHRSTHGARALGLPIHFGVHGISLRRLWWAAIFLLGISASAVGWTIWQLRTDAINAAISDSGNIAAILAGQLSRSLHSIDAVLLEVRKSKNDMRIDSAPAFRAAYNQKTVHESLAQALAGLPQIFNIAIADENGQLVVSTAAWPTPDINISDRDYFQNARARGDDRLSASVPINNRINGAQTIVFARRLESTNGAFMGIVYASVNTKYFEDIYGSIQSVRSLMFTLVRQDGIILFRHPDPGNSAGRRLSAEAAWLQALSGGAKGFRVLAQADGNVRFVSFRPISDYPLFVNTSVTESAALAGWFQRSITIGLGSAALLLCSLGLMMAITRQVRSLSNSERALKEKSQQLDAALNNMSQGLAMFDSQQRLVVCNKQFSELYGLTPEHTQPGTLLRDILEARVAFGKSPDRKDFVEGVLAQASSHESYSIVDELRDGRVVSITSQPMNHGGWVAVHQDITARKRAEAKLAHMARYDSLTGLANRARFLEKVNDAIARMRRLGQPFSLLMLDLDRFKAVNDCLGHATGDSLLKAFAERLREIVGTTDDVARLGGDEFALLQTVEQNRSDLSGKTIALANRIRETITRPYDLDGRKIIIGTSIGITLAPDDGRDADALMRNADLALYKAKGEGRNRYRFFETSMEEAARERRELEEDMRKAISRDEFEIHYQTIIDLGGRVCCGAEALVRWRHPRRGLIPPDQFIPIAEDSGLIIPLGERILRKTCAEVAKWPAHLKVAVNLSPMQFKQDDLLGVLRATLAEFKLAPTRLELEITESVLVEKTEENLAILHEIKNLGVAVVLDDFGIGYSSMRYLQMFPFDKIKIDKSFIQSMTNHAESAAIVQAIAGLGRSLDIETTAEGVETAEQLVLVRTAGCNMAQGFLLSRPVPAGQLAFECPQAARAGTKAA